MITLYLKTGCPFSARVLAVVDAYQIPFIERNIGTEGVWEELVTLGGKHQVPFMVDGDIMMYDSTAINQYLENKFAHQKISEPRVQASDDNHTCTPI